MDDRIIKFFLGELTQEEEIALLKERETNAGIKKAFASCQNTLALFSLSPGAADSKKAAQKLAQFRRMERQQKIRRIVYRTVGYAASIALIVASTWFIATQTVKVTPEEARLFTGQQQLFVPAGQRARITLPDGTVAWLNAGSTLVYPSVFENERNVTLSGEGFFEVVEDKEVPFIVSTGNLRMKVLGTQFNVYSYPKSDQQSIILVDGAVKVYRPDAEADGLLMNPYQQLVYKNGAFRMEAFVDNDLLLWKDGIYSFKNERLDAIIHKLELYFDVDIVINSPSLLEKRYTGKFRQRDGVMEILRIIQKIHPFGIEKDEELNRVILSQ